MHNSQPGVGIDFRGRVKIAESCPKTFYNLWYVNAQYMVLKKAPYSCLFTVHQ